MVRVRTKRIYNSIINGGKISYAKQRLGRNEVAEQLTESINALPPVLDATFKETVVQQKYLEDFEELSLCMRDRYLHHGDCDEATASSREYYCRAEDIVEAILKAKRFFAKNPYRYKNPPALKLVGLSIEGDLNLSKIDIPFSIRLICCHISGALVADRAIMVTLDLSGTIIEGGASCNYITCHGALRMRRMVSLAPMSFDGAEIKAAIDAADSIIIPKNDLSSLISYVADRGVLNFHLAKIGKEMRLPRARIYGGINLRGARIEGSLFLSDAIIRSPLGTLEKITFEGYRADDNIKDSMILRMVSVHSDGTLAARMHSTHRDNITREIISDKIVPKNSDNYDNSILNKLIQESQKASYSSILAEGLSVGGNFISRSMKAVGSINLKFVTIKGSLVMTGIRLRGVESVLMPLPEKVEKSSEVLFFEEKVQKIESDYRRLKKTVYAIDLFEAKIGGSFDLSKERRLSNSTHSSEYEKSLCEHVAAALCATGEDPLKFLPYGVADRKKHYVNSSSESHKENHLKNELESIAKKVDGVFYRKRKKLETLDKELADNSISDGDRAKKQYVKMKLISEYPFSSRRLELSEAIQKEVKTAFREHADLFSTMVEGRMRLDNTEISGSIKLNGLISNLFLVKCREYYPVYPFLSLQNANIGGDLDCRDTLGVLSINAREASFGGSVRFSDSEEYNPNWDTYQPLRGRAFLLCKSFFGSEPGQDAEHWNSLRFERATIGGDGVFVFDPSEGPKIDLAQASIAGKLSILPARGGLETYKEIAKSTGSICQSADVKTRPSSGFQLEKICLEGYKTALYKKFTTSRERPYRIDLRRVSTNMFVHPPSAWPEDGGLLIEGFSYNLTKDIGPLTPPRRSWGQIWSDAQINRGWQLTIFFLCFIIFASSVLMFILFTPEILQSIGIFNVVTLLLILFCIALSKDLQNFIRPNNRDAQPLALKWLEKQRPYASTRRTYSWASPHEPYIRAASVLRASGRATAADHVELLRIRKRVKEMSFRSSFIVRMFLVLTDRFVNYGFRPMRAIWFTSIILVIAAMLLNLAATEGRVIATDEQLLRTAKELQSNPDKQVPSTSKHSGAEERTASCNHNKRVPLCAPDAYPKFISLLFAIDVFVPFIDLRQEKHWMIVPNSSKGSVEGENSSFVPMTLLSSLYIILKVLGWFTTVALAVSVTTRIETIMARSEENK